MRTVRPRLDMSALICELCEGDVPEIDWEKLAMDNSSVYDIYTGLKLDEEQVRAGRETEVKRMLEFEVCEEVNEQQAPWQENLEQCLVGFTEKTRTSEVETGGQSSQRCEQARRRVCGHTTTCSDAFHFCPVLHCVVMAVASTCGMCRWHSSTQQLRKKCLFDRQRTCEKTRPSGDS